MMFTGDVFELFQRTGRDADKDGSGLISAKELYKAIIQGEARYSLIHWQRNVPFYACTVDSDLRMNVVNQCQP